MRRSQVPGTLTLRELNRATLARQLLLRRMRVDPVEAIERLAGLQAQWSPSPYLALWSRVSRFRRDDLSAAMLDRRVVKATLMRTTLHLVSAREYPHYARLTSQGRARLLETAARGLGLDTAHLNEELLGFAASTPRSLREIGEFVVERTGPSKHPVSTVARFALWTLLSSDGWLVNAPPNGLWGSPSGGQFVAARSWLHPLAVPSGELAAVHVLRRYLGAFGPATIADAASWSHGRPAVLRAALEELGEEVVAFRDERGRTHYDLRRAPRPGPDVAAPVRFLPKWDSLLLAYQAAERIRVLPEHLRKAVIAVNGDVTPTVLIDGVVAARWDAREAQGSAIVSVAPFGRIRPADREAIVEEGERLARFIHPDARSHGVKIVQLEALPRWNLSIRP